MVVLILQIVFAIPLADLKESLSNFQILKVEFIQEDIYPWYPEPEVSKGVFYLSSDGRYRLDYLEPDRTVILYNLKERILYSPEEKTALISPEEDKTSRILLSLLSRGEPLEKHFRIIDQKASNLVLEPKEDMGIKYVKLSLQGKILKVVEFEDSEGNRTILRIISITKDPKEGDPFSLDLPKDVKIKKVP